MLENRFWSAIMILMLFIGHMSAANYGKISGRITDVQTGAPLMGANVYIESINKGAATDIDGFYVILNIPPGEYVLTAQYLGYHEKKITEVVVRTNRTSYIDFKLYEETVELSTLVVVGDRPVVERDNAATTRSVTDKIIKELPVTTVNEVIQTQPGVVNSDGIHFRGGRSGEVIYYIDGIPLINSLYNGLGTSNEVVNQNAISEMQIVSGTYSAEYGNSMSGIVNITTRDGSDELRFNIDVRSTTIGIEENSKNQNRNVIRGDISMPLIPSVTPNTKLFLSYNNDSRDNYLPWGYNKNQNVFAKITDQNIDNIKLSASVNYGEGKRHNYSHSYKYIPEMYWYEPNTKNMTLQLGLTHTLSNTLFYNLFTYYNQNYYDSGDYDYNDLTSAYDRDENNEFLTFATVTSYEKDIQNTYGLKGDILWQVNINNEVKGGFQYRQLDIDRFYISAPYYDDHILDDYLRKPVEFAAYLQDKISFNFIILSLGLRYDYYNPNTDYWSSPYEAYAYLNNGGPDLRKTAQAQSQLSPRLAISYPIMENTVFHFGYGHFFQRPRYEIMYKVQTDVDYTENMVMNLVSGNGRFGDPDLKPEKTVAYEFGVSHQIFDDYLINVSMYRKNITNLVGVRTFFAGDQAEDGTFYWETWTKHINEDFAWTNGLEIQLRKMRGNYFYGEINYTYAVAEGSSSRPLERAGVEEANRQSLKFFPLDYDQRHSLNANLIFLPGYSSRLSFLMRYGSGLPYSPERRGATEPYEINGKRMPDTFTMDMKFDIPFQWGNTQLIPYIEIYNLTDNDNVVYVYPSTGQPDYLEGRTADWAQNPLNYGPPRLIYFGLRFQFN